MNKPKRRYKEASKLKPKPECVSVTLTAEGKIQLDEIARAQGLAMTVIIRRAIEFYLATKLK